MPQKKQLSRTFSTFSGLGPPEQNRWETPKRKNCVDFLNILGVSKEKKNQCLKSKFPFFIFGWSCLGKNTEDIVYIFGMPQSGQGNSLKICTNLKSFLDSQYLLSPIPTNLFIINNIFYQRLQALNHALHVTASVAIFWVVCKTYLIQAIASLALIFHIFLVFSLLSAAWVCGFLHTCAYIFFGLRMTIPLFGH